MGWERWEGRDGSKRVGRDRGMLFLFLFGFNDVEREDAGIKRGRGGYGPSFVYDYDSNDTINETSPSRDSKTRR